MELEALLASARGGHRQAWDELLGWARPYVRALLRRGLNCPHDASDLTNDVQLRMHKGLPEFRGESRQQFLAWTRVIIANVLHNHYERRRPSPGPLLAEPPATACDPAVRLARAEDIVRLSAALEELPADYRAVIEARLFEGLSAQAIAARFGWPAVRARVYAHRAVKRLSQKLRGEA